MAGCGVSLADSEAAKGPRGRSAPIPVQVSSAGGSLQDGPSPTLTDCTPSGLSRFSSVFLPLASRADRYEIDSDAPSGNYRRSTRADRPASEKTPGRAPRTDCTASTGDRSMERHRIGASRTCPPSSSAKTRTCSRILRKPSFPRSGPPEHPETQAHQWKTAGTKHVGQTMAGGRRWKQTTKNGSITTNEGAMNRTGRLGQASDQPMTWRLEI
jgi:hypothetical protein